MRWGSGRQRRVRRRCCRGRSWRFGCRRRCGGGRCRMRRRSGRRSRVRRCGRCCRGRRGMGRRWGSFGRRALLLSLWRLLRFSVGTEFALWRLCDDDRSGLRVRRRGREVHRRQSRGGEQRETKVCHDDVSPRKGSEQIKDSSAAESFGVPINSQSLGRIVAGDKTQTLFISIAQWFTRAIVHCAFRSALQMKFLHHPLRH